MLVSKVASLIAGVSQSQDRKGHVTNTMGADDHTKEWISNTGLLKCLSFFCLGVRGPMLSFGLFNRNKLYK